jgi:hypothetical protein
VAAKVSKWTPERRPEVEDALRSSRTRADAAKTLDVSLASLDFACRTFGLEPASLLGRGEAVTIQAPPPSGLSKKELIEEMKVRHARLTAHEAAKRLIPVRVAGDLPIALHGDGDLHLDDPGTNIGLVEENARIVRETPGMYGFTPGDLLNNWIGRLMRLHARQNVTEAEGWQLVEWYIEEVRDWLFVVLGNHDLWAGNGSPMQWISRNAGLFSQAHDVRMALRFSNGNEARVHCRHDFPGSSIYNDSHGLLRAALFGHRDHVKCAGHRHISSYQLVPDSESGIAMHMVRVAGYKQIDDYATEGGYLKRSLGPAVTLVIDPRLPNDHPDFIKPFWDTREGAAYLTFLRKRRPPARGNREARAA